MQITEGFTAVPTEQLLRLRDVVTAALQSLNANKSLGEALTLLGEQRLRDMVWPEGSGEGIPLTMKNANDPTSQTPEETAFWRRAEDGIVKCNCKFDLGHEPTCAIVAANQQWLNRKREIE
jgi:hypothetical protein